MNAPTYQLRPSGAPPERYARDVARLADEVLEAGGALRPLVQAYRSFVADTGREPPRSEPEYLVEALTLGVLWRARGSNATELDATGREFVDRLAAHRRAGGARPRDGSNAWILSLDAPFEPGHPAPTLAELDRLLAWLVASGEYDDEVARLDGWRAFLDTLGAEAEDLLQDVVIFAIAFEAWSEQALGVYTANVRSFLRDRLPGRRWREDTVQCSRGRTEYHLNMVGAELLNRAWRAEFARCRRHVVVMPGCMRRHEDERCRAERNGLDLRCTGCTSGCAVLAATRVARRAEAEAVAVVHGSDFSRFLRSPALAGGDVGIVGIACVPGLLGAGWRAYAAGFPAQCVLLDASGCSHWRDVPVPTAIDLHALQQAIGVAAPSGPVRGPHRAIQIRVSPLNPISTAAAARSFVASFTDRAERPYERWRSERSQ